MNDKKDVLDNGLFFHGTKAELKIGDLLEPQHLSNYQNKKSNYIYFTSERLFFTLSRCGVSKKFDRKDLLAKTW